jgi:glycosyltransferase involved in cell wall biosynthesis
MRPQVAVEPEAPVLFLSHEASRTGAPILLLRLLSWLRRNTNLEFDVLLGSDGPLAASFARLANTRIGRHERLERYRLVYANSVFSHRLLGDMPAAPVPVLTHVHEMEAELFGVPLRVAAPRQRFVAVARCVARRLVDLHGVDPEEIVLQYGFVDVAEAQLTPPADVARRELGISEETLVVGSAGTFWSYKGADLFVDLADAVAARRPQRPIAFIWAGGDMQSREFGVLEARRARGLRPDSLAFTGEVPDPRPVFAAFDVFAMTSREDPFPLVCLEAAALGLPILTFDAGGACEFVARGCGFVVPAYDVDAMADHVVTLAADPALRRRVGRRARELVLDEHDIGRACRRLARLIDKTAPPERPNKMPVTAGSPHVDAQGE